MRNGRLVATLVGGSGGPPILDRAAAPVGGPPIREPYPMPREFPRTRRVGEQIQRELAELIREEVKDPRLGMVTILGVQVSRDLSHAKVFVSVLGDHDQVAESLRILKRVAGFLRHALGQRMVIRTVPQLQFVHDESVERGSRLSSLIDEAVASDAAKSPKKDTDD